MIDSTNPRTEFTAAIRDLWQEAGAPTVREISAMTNSEVPHGTVHTLLSGKYLSTWPTVDRIIVALGGDPEAYQPLWQAARAERIPQVAHADPHVMAAPGAGDGDVWGAPEVIQDIIRDGLADIAAAIRALRNTSLT